MDDATIWDAEHIALTLVTIAGCACYMLAMIVSCAISLSGTKGLPTFLKVVFGRESGIGDESTVTAVDSLSESCGAQDEKWMSIIPALIGWGCNVALFLMNWQRLGWDQKPFGSIYHVLVVLAACCVPAFIFLHYYEKIKASFLTYFCGAAFITLVGCLNTMTKANVWKMVPVLRSNWFVPHVFSYMLSYSMCAVAFIVIFVAVFRNPNRQREQVCFWFFQAALMALLLLELKQLTLTGFWIIVGVNAGIAIFSLLLRLLPANDEQTAADELTGYKISLFGFPFMTFGLVSGMLWALDSWGLYWSWDIKEIWGLITWMLYLVYFHVRKQPRLKNFSTLIIIAAFWALIMTFFFVNILNKPGMSNHAYTQQG